MTYLWDTVVSFNDETSIFHHVSAHKLELIILFSPGNKVNQTNIINPLRVISLVTTLLRLSDQQAREAEREKQVGGTTPAENKR